MESLTKRVHQEDLRSPIGPCFTVFVYNEACQPILNVHLSYNPPGSWRILFWSGGYPKKFSHLKNFRALVVLGKGYHKGIYYSGEAAKAQVLLWQASHA